MMEEYLGLFGVDVAIKKLRPGAEFALYNTTFTMWECPNGSEPPSWDEINEQIQKDMEAINTKVEEV
jgi:hypothetical protein